MGVTVTECEEPPEVEGMRVSYQRVGTFSNAHHGKRNSTLREHSHKYRRYYTLDTYFIV